MFKRYDNKYARWIRALAIVVIVINLVIGLFFWAQDFEDHFLWFVTTVLISAIVVVSMFGFAEIIETLFRIYKRLDSDNGWKTLLDKPAHPE